MQKRTKESDAEKKKQVIKNNIYRMSNIYRVKRLARQSLTYP